MKRDASSPALLASSSADSGAYAISPPPPFHFSIARLCRFDYDATLRFISPLSRAYLPHREVGHLRTLPRLLLSRAYLLSGALMPTAFGFSPSLFTLYLATPPLAIYDAAACRRFRRRCAMMPPSGAI